MIRIPEPTAGMVFAALLLAVSAPDLDAAGGVYLEVSPGTSECYRPYGSLEI